MVEKNYQHNLVKNDHRLKKNSQFNYVFRKGQRVASQHFLLFISNSKFENYKIGFSISKKIGKAWKRNLLRRRIKEILRLNNLAMPYKNYVLKAREGAGELDYKQIESQLFEIFDKGKNL